MESIHDPSPSPRPNIPQPTISDSRYDFHSDGSTDLHVSSPPRSNTVHRLGASPSFRDPPHHYVNHTEEEIQACNSQDEKQDGRISQIRQTLPKSRSSAPIMIDTDTGVGSSPASRIEVALPNRTMVDSALPSSAMTFALEQYPLDETRCCLGMVECEETSDT